MRKKFFYLILISLFLLIFDYFGVLTPFKNPLEPAVSAAKKSVYSGGYKLKLLPEIIINYKSIVSEFKNVTDLKNQISQFKSENDSLIRENSTLRNQLGADLPSALKFIPADVISLTRYMEINIGLSDGVKKGMSVVDGSNLVGKIISVTGARAKVQLISDPDLIVPAISNRGTRGKISGNLGENAEFSEVLQKDPLFLDDILETSGEEGFRAKLLIGRIVFIDSDDVAVYKKARIKPAVKFNLLTKVFVVAQL